MTSEADLIAWCAAAVDETIRRHPEDQARLAELRSLLRKPPGPLADRRASPGHLTASGIVFDPSDRMILLMHHRGLDRWLQPGGHLDAGELPLEAARREIFEETGVTVVTALSPVHDRALPIDIDSHAIPASAKKNEPAHTHHDFRFAFAVDRLAHPLTIAESEAADIAWMSLDDPRFPDDLRRCAQRVFKGEVFEFG